MRPSSYACAGAPSNRRCWMAARPHRRADRPRLALLPWWMLVIGTRLCHHHRQAPLRGLGQNLFNPAMVAYVLLLVSFPVQMTSWLPSSIAASATSASAMRPR